jgi:hypothetical protein
LESVSAIKIRGIMWDVCSGGSDCNKKSRKKKKD